MVQEDLAATRTQWVRVAPRVPSQTWLDASRTGWVRVAPSTARDSSGRFFDPYLKGVVSVRPDMSKTLVICLLKVPPPLLHSHVLRSLVHLFNSLES